MCKHLSESLFIPHVREYAREYIAALDRTYDQSDLLHIAKGQLELEKDILSQTPSFLICDTDLLTIKIWSEYKYSCCDSEIIRLFKNNLPDLYLLASPDFPWERRFTKRKSDNREELFSIYEKEILDLEVPYKVISGTESERLEIAWIYFQIN